jgi:serine protease Do
MAVFRKGGEITLQVKIGEMQVKEEAEEPADQDEETQEAPTGAEKISGLGVSVAPLSDTLRQKYDIKKDVKGMVVTDVTPDGIAAENGIAEGEVISEAAQKEVKSAHDLTDQVKAAQKDGKPLLLLVNRKDDMRFVAITFGKKK